MANAGKGRGGNRVSNDEIDRMYREYDLNEAGQSWVHRQISKRRFTREEIEDTVREASERAKFRNSHPNR